jgi:hypothetical protein
MADANDSAAILAQVNDDLKNLGYISQATADRMRDAETGVKDFNTKMALGAASAMYKGEKGAAAFNSSIDSMAEAATAAGAVLTLMIPGGVIVKALVAGMTLAVGAVAKYTKAANEMSDTLYTTFQKMSKSGAAASDGLMGIYGDMQKLGLGIQDLDGYVDMINASSRDLALFGGSVFAGRKAFADIGAAMTPFREQLYNAGLSQEQVNAGAMSYIKQQAQTDLRSAQLKAMQAAQDFVSKGMLPATEAAIKMAGATESAATGLNNFMDGLTKLTKWLFGWLQGEEARAKTKEEIVADEKAAAAKTKYDKAFAGVPGGNMAQRELGIGATAEQKAALEAHKEAQRAAVQARKDADKKYGTTKESAAKAGMPSSGTTAAPAGAPSGGQPSTGTAPAPAPVSGGITAQDLAGAGLNIRGYGDVQAAGQAVSPALIELAKKIQNSVEGFQYFSGFNDKYHHENNPTASTPKAWLQTLC